MKSKRYVGLVSLFVIVALCLAGVFPLDAKEKPKRGGIFRTPYWKAPGILDPATVRHNNDVMATTQVYNALVNYVPGTWEVYPDLAERYEVSNDQVVYTFHLRKGVKFHNGREMTADDVVYSLQRAGQPKFANSDRHRKVDKVEALDKYIVRITLKEYDPVFLQKMAGVTGSGIVPKEVVEKYGRQFGTSPEATCGTGPFVLKERIPGRTLILEANPNYYRGKPFIDKMEYRYITTTAAMIMELEAGNLEFTRLVPPHIKKFREDPKWKPYVHTGAYPNWFYYTFNVHAEPFNNVKLRKALAYAFDRERAVKVVTGGIDTAIHSFVPEGFDGYDASIKYYEYNPEMAKKLLKEAGYPNGVTINCKVHNYFPMRRTTEFYIAQLAELGINFKVDFVESGTHRAERKKCKYAFHGQGWGIKLPDVSAYLYKFFHTDNFGPPGNYCKYKNEEVDKYIDLAMAEQNPKKKVEYIRKAEKLIMDDSPWVLSHARGEVCVSQPWVHGLEGKVVGHTGRWDYINYGNHEIWIDAEKQKQKK